MNRYILIYIVIGAIIISLFAFYARNGKVLGDADKSIPNAIKKLDSTESQIIEITARGGYSPTFIEAKANVNTILRVSTRNTFDCSSAITIPEFGISENLPVTGTKDFDIGSHKAGEQLNGSCSMGMYGFTINFK